MLDAGQRLRFDIALKSGNLGTIADDPYMYLGGIRAKTSSLTGPAPRTPDGRPDLSGVWNGKDHLFPEKPDLLPGAANILNERFSSVCQAGSGKPGLPIG